jgi:hypothetical protein
MVAEKFLSMPSIHVKKVHVLMLKTKKYFGLHITACF